MTVTRPLTVTNYGTISDPLTGMDEVTVQKHMMLLRVSKIIAKMIYSRYI